MESLLMGVWLSIIIMGTNLGIKKHILFSSSNTSKECALAHEEPILLKES